LKFLSKPAGYRIERGKKTEQEEQEETQRTGRRQRTDDLWGGDDKATEDDV
jgi:hypothetical protein